MAVYRDRPYSQFNFTVDLGNGDVANPKGGFQEVSGLGALTSPEHIRSTLWSIYKYNHKPNLFNHNTVQRTFALNDEAALVICDYAKHSRPKIWSSIPFA